MCGIKLLFLSAIGVLFTLGLDQVTAIEVSTPSEVTAVNGTDVKLKCSFKSTQPVSENLVAVNWMFRPLGQTSSQPKEISVFYYQQKSYPPTDGMFKDHVTWSGNVMKNDASITLLDVQFTFNGTYRCQVQNPPDVHGYTGEISLQVVQSVGVSLSYRCMSRKRK
ncbi:myelin protein zero-like protein 2b isoform X2 [Hoplias malabaricus]|uniref:myelin protein zero-like protein 2b isoform X2 n=1 Tax=Hoplias malabaricus TaxID=27720 RepID=UPI00346368F0